MIQSFLHNLGDLPVLGKVIIHPPFEVNPQTLNNEARIIYVVEGTSVLRTPTYTLNLGKGDCVVISSGNIVNNWLPSEGSKTYQAFFFRLSPDILETMYKHPLPAFLSHTETGNQPSLPAYRIPPNTTIEKFIEGLQHYFDNPELFDEELVIIKLREFLFLLMTLEGENGMQTVFKNLFNPIAHEFTEIVQAHLFERLSLDELAHLCGMSLSSFNRKFRKVYEESPKKYILTQRLNRAKELLAQPELRISEIAFDCCFEDPANFSKSFSAHFGISPSQYRNSALA